MKFPSRFGVAVVCSASSLLILAFGSLAFAAGNGLPEGSARWLALDRCAAYGPDFTAVEGTQLCAKIGGHVRVELGSRNYGDQDWNQGGTAPAAMRTETPVGSDDSGYPVSHHLRLRQDSAPLYSGYLH